MMREIVLPWWSSRIPYAQGVYLVGYLLREVIMGGKPSKGTKRDRRLSGNRKPKTKK